MAGLCGSAVFHNQPVSVTDIATDPRWEIVRPEALHAGLAACWSNPIVGSSGMVLGAFALYFPEARGPSEVEQEKLGEASVGERVWQTVWYWVGARYLKKQKR